MSILIAPIKKYLKLTDKSPDSKVFGFKVLNLNSGLKISGDDRRPKREMRGNNYENETYANLTLAFERCCVTKMRFTSVCIGTLRVCFKHLKSNVLRIKLTYRAFLSYSLLFHGV